MQVLPCQLRDLFDEIETDLAAVSEGDLAVNIARLREVDPPLIEDDLEAVNAEFTAFWLQPNYPGHDSPPGAYYGLRRERVTSTHWDYWDSRLNEARHPILRCRYADLCHDFALQVGRTPHSRLASAVVDATTVIIACRLFQEAWMVHDKLERAVDLAWRLKDLGRQSELKNTILDFLETAEMHQPGGGWGVAFKLFMNPKRSGVEISDEARIVSGLKSDLKELREAEHVNPESTLQRTEMLWKYFHTIASKADDEARELVQSQTDLALNFAETNPGLLGQSVLTETYSFVLGKGFAEQEKQLAASILKAADETKEGMVKFTLEMVFAPEATRSLIEEAATRTAHLRSGSDDELLNRLISEFVPDATEALQSAARSIQSAPIVYFFNDELPDERKGIRLGRDEEQWDDPEQYLRSNLLSKIKRDAAGLRVVMNELANRSGEEGLLAELLGGPWIAESRRPFIEGGIRAAMNDDHIAAAHLLIPQVEQGLRLLATAAGEFPFKQKGGKDLVPMPVEELLRLVGLRSLLGEDVVTYFSVVLSGNGGWNLRNEALHGRMEPEEFSSTSTDRLIHMLLCLVRVPEPLPPRAHAE